MASPDYENRNKAYQHGQPQRQNHAIVMIRWTVGLTMSILAKSTASAVRFAIQRGGQRESKSVTPLSAAAWAVFRQTGLETTELSIRDAAETVRTASTEFYRAFHSWLNEDFYLARSWRSFRKTASLRNAGACLSHMPKWLAARASLTLKERTVAKTG